MTRLLKPKIVNDIKSSKGDCLRSNFEEIPRIVNLSHEPVMRVPILPYTKTIILGFALLLLFLGSVAAPTISTRAADTSNDAERAQLEAQLKDLQNQIDQYQGQITSYQKQGKTLKGQISVLNDKISKLNLQIKAVNLTLSDLDIKINETQVKIGVTESSILQNKQALSRLILNLYQNERVSLVEVFLKNPRLSDFFSNLNNLTLLQSNVRDTINQISDLQNELKNQKDQFALARADAATVKQYQAAQLNQTGQLKQEKNDLLSATKGQESRYQDLLTKTKETAAQIRSRIFQLLGGGQLTFEQAYSYAKLAGDATGVRPAFLLAVLDRESALGQNVGKCSYKTAMSPSNQTVFLDLVKRLNIDPGTISVSCPNADGVYGGAMGPAQFIPSTWMLYTDAVSKVTGHNPASPWNNADAFVASALYLKDAGAVSSERTAAARYYCGSNWKRYVCTNVYGQKVVDQADQFQEDIDAINH